MPRWLEIAITLVLFSLVMLGLSGVVQAVVPGFVDWAWDRFGGVASWTAFLALMAACGIYVWQDHRRAGTKPNGR